LALDGVMFLLRSRIEAGFPAEFRDGFKCGRNSPRAHAGISAIRSNELLGVSDGERLESRAARAASGAHPELEAVGVLHGAKNRRGKGN
jgi:hypothetical protein